MDFTYICALIENNLTKVKPGIYFYGICNLKLKKKKKKKKKKKMKRKEAIIKKFGKLKFYKPYHLKKKPQMDNIWLLLAI